MQRPDGLTKNDLEAIGTGQGLTDARLTQYVTYMMLRNFVWDTAHAVEWAREFTYGTEYRKSDETGRKLLDELYNS